MQPSRRQAIAAGCFEIVAESGARLLAPGTVLPVDTCSYFAGAPDGRVFGNGDIELDTGFSEPQIMGNLGMKGWWCDGQGMEKALDKHGLKLEDIRYVLHTHLHIDHAGYDHHFPMDTTVLINGRELEYSVSGLMGEQYPAPYIKHLVDRLHDEGGALRLSTSSTSMRRRSSPGSAASTRAGTRRAQ